MIDLNSRALSDNRLDTLGTSAAPAPGMTDPDYKNLQYSEDGRLCMDPEVDLSAASFNDQIKILGNIVVGVPPTHNYENTGLSKPPSSQGGVSPRGVGPDPDDYMNDNPEGWDHTYTNQDDLLLQVSPVAC